MLNFLLLYFFACSTLVYGATAPEEWDAEEYVDNGLLQFKWAKRFFFDRFKFTGREQVLDIGCGDGRLTQLIAKCLSQGGVVLGMDNSPSMIHYASKTYPPEQFPNLRFELADASNPQFYEKFESTFDLIVSFHCLHWVEGQKNALLGIRRALKSGGRAFLRLTSKGWDPIQESADELIKSPKWKSYFTLFRDPMHRYSQEEYLKLLYQANLFPIQIEERVEDDILPNVDILEKQIKSWLPHLKHLPASLQNAFLQDVISSYLIKSPPQKNGTIHLYDCFLEVECMK